jgi:CRISPR system Cascade subunit CasB
MTDPTEKPPSFASAPVQGRLRSWWEGLSENRGDRAELKRSRSVDEVLLTEAYHKLRLRIAGTGLQFTDDQLGPVAGLLAHVDEDAPNGDALGAHMAGGSPEEDVPVSGGRFRRLLEHENRDDLYRPMIRIIRLLDRRLSVGVLARDVYFWGTGVRKRWARSYYENALDEV